LAFWVEIAIRVHL